MVGYVASNSVTVHIRHLVDAGAIISAAVAAGANQTSGPSLASSEQKELYRRALKAAVADARSRAAAIASASDATVGEIRSVSESSSGAPIPFEAKAARDQLGRGSRRAGEGRGRGAGDGDVRA